MSEETKEMLEETQEQMQDEKSVEGWKDVQIHADIPLSAIIQFLNILNARLCEIENLVKVHDNEGNEISLTELYALQSQAEMAEKESK